jgi:hypothetical protein
LVVGDRWRAELVDWVAGDHRPGEPRHHSPTPTAAAEAVHQFANGT